MRECYRFIVTGRVQGVYFRQSTREQALALGLDGWVRNRPDGRVEGVACGGCTALQALQHWLHRGPAAARVDELQWMPTDEHPAPGFEVRR